MTSTGVHLATGRRVGPYEIIEPLGAGGMGEVYRARDSRLHRDVALKVLPPALVSDPQRRARFVQEARAASALEHPHIGVIHEIGDADGITFIAMELVRGEPLRDVIARGPLPPARALALAVEIAEGLARVHETGIVHRDLKPANVMVTAEGHAKIIDFGLAKLVDALCGDASAPTRTGLATESGVVLGTAAYMSPEQTRGEAVDHRSDVFSFGIVLHEMLAGRPPFRRASGVETMHAILYDLTPTLPPSIGASIRDLQGVVDKCLAKRPADRYQQTQDLVVDLRAARRLVDAGLSGVAAAGTPRALLRHRSAQVALGVTAAVVVIAVLGAWTFARRARAEVERHAVIAEVERLVDLGRFVDVWRVAQPALRRWPGDPQLTQMLGATTMSVTLATDPPGAGVEFKAYDDIQGEWIALGTSPLKGVRAPLGMLRWRLTKPGYDPLEARLEVGTPAAAVGRPDVDAPPIRLRSAGSDLPRMVFVSGDSHSGGQLTNYSLDQYEVTNRAFKAFIDRGGYDDPRHWTHLDGGREAAAARFRDRTGQPGPASWELGTYPDGHDDYPVGGVSWFEAVAFCRAAGKNLPTVSHWKKAFGETFFMEVVTLGNFGGKGPAPVTRLNDVGPWGTYGMAGNVKEWVWNEVEGRRFILGGAWNEPVYMVIDGEALPPFDRSETNGLRCIMESAPSSSTVYAASVAPPARASTKAKPVDAATFEIFRRLYSYDRTPLDGRTEKTEELGQWRRERVSFAAAYAGDRVLAHILIPKNATPPYQAVIWFPGSYALDLKHSDGDLPFSYYFDFLPRSGRALVYPVYQGTYERSGPQPSGGMNQLRDLLVHWQQDVGRTIDYLGSRSDFDTTRIAFYGFSMGTGPTIRSLALEPRLRTGIVLTGGLYDGPTLPEIDSVNFAPRITVPFLLLGGRYDFGFPVETSQKPLFDLVGSPAEHKRHVVFEEAGHVPPRLGVIREVLAWLDRYLGPVERQRRGQ